VPVALDDEQAVALHPGDGLADGGAALVQSLGDPGTLGTTPSSSSSRIVFRYISVVSTRSFTALPSRYAMVLAAYDKIGT